MQLNEDSDNIIKAKAIEMPPLITSQELVHNVKGKNMLLTILSVSWSSGKEFDEAHNR